MADDVGIVETKEAIQGACALTAALIRKFKDGFQPTDIVELAVDAELRMLIQAAVDGSKQIPAEMRDLKADEYADLTVTTVQGVVQIISAVRS